MADEIKKHLVVYGVPPPEYLDAAGLYYICEYTFDGHKWRSHTMQRGGDYSEVRKQYLAQGYIECDRQKMAGLPPASNLLPPACVIRVANDRHQYFIHVDFSNEEFQVEEVDIPPELKSKIVGNLEAGVLIDATAPTIENR